MEHLFSRLFGRGMMRPFDWSFPEWEQFHGFEEYMPAVDVIDRDDAVLVRAQPYIG